MKPRPLSKTQGGNWWIIRRANGSVVPETLERTQRAAWRSLVFMHNGKVPEGAGTTAQAEELGYSAERVQICSMRRTANSKRLTVVVPSTFCASDDVEVLI